MKQKDLTRLQLKVLILSCKYLVSCTIAIIILALFPPVLLVMPVLLRLLAIGRIAPRTTAVTLLLGIAGLFGLMTFIRTHVNTLDLTRS